MSWVKNHKAFQEGHRLIGAILRVGLSSALQECFGFGPGNWPLCRVKRSHNGGSKSTMAVAISRGKGKADSPSLSQTTANLVANASGVMSARSMLGSGDSNVARNQETR